MNTLSAGMVKDTSPLAQKEGTYTYAQNAVLESVDGDFPFISNEIGNSNVGTLPTGSIVIGKCLTNTDTQILCLVTPTTSIIGEYNPKDNSFTTIVNDASLNFDTRFPVKMLFRIRKGCVRTINITDDYNPYRIIEIDNLEQYGSPFDVSKTNLTRNVTTPTIELSAVQDFGGALDVGTYQFFIQYLDDNLNPTGWTGDTLPIPIVDENLSDLYYKIDGGYAIVDSSNEEGAVPKTSKAISLSISGLDLDFPYYRISVAISSAGTGQVSEVWHLETIAINSPISTYVYRGVNQDTHTSGDTAELTVDPVRVYKVKTHAQLDNRLFLADLSYNQYDWAEVQRQANNIAITWNTIAIPKQSIANGSAKSPFYYTQHRSYLRDEVYAFGIYGVFTSGEETPVFHIPGRASNAADTVLLTVGSTVALEDVRHLGITTPGTTVETWKVWNTATVLGNAMAYWESETDYPDTEDCNGNRIFPVGKIRHHKFPSVEISPIETSTSIHPIGISCNINAFIASLPSSLTTQIQEWKLVRAVRTDDNKTIEDKGYIATGQIAEASSTSYDINAGDIGMDPTYLSTTGPGTQFNEKYHFFWSPKQMFNRESYVADYLSIEKKFEVPYNASSFVQRWFIDWSTHGVSGAANRLYNSYAHIDRYKYLDGTDLGNGATPSTVPAYPVVAITMNSDRIYNPSYSTPIAVFNTQDNYEWDRDGNTPSAARFSYIAVKKAQHNPYSSLHALTYIDVKDAISNIYFNGDIFISSMGFKFGALSSLWAFYNAYYETEINSELRHLDTNNLLLNSYYKENINTTSFLVGYAQGYYPTDDHFYVRPEYFAYNADYSKINLERPKFPLPFNYNYCSVCNNNYPFRIIASEKSFQTEISDNYKVFKANNFIDLNGDCGSITHLFVDSDNLYCLTTNYPVFIPTKNQTLQSNEATIYVGTGEIFSQPVKRLVTPMYKYGGCQDWMSIVTTEFGTFYVDADNGKVHRLNSPPSSLSEGMSNWLEENLPFKLIEQLYANTSTLYPYRTTTNGIGITSTWDARHKRYIVTKKDYELLPNITFRGIGSFEDLGTLNYVYFDVELGKYYANIAGINTIISLDNASYFKNLSWTLSYSPRHNAWASYHSYLPYIYSNDSSTFYSFNTGSINIWEHNTGSYQSYYAQKKDHILELIINPNPSITKTFESLELVSTSSNNNVLSNTITYDRAVFFNSYQSSGLKTLTLKSNPFLSDYSDTSCLINKVSNSWRINNIRDYSIPNTALFSTNWTDLQSDYFIDKVVNPLAINTTTLKFNTSRLRDKWMGVRLYFNPALSNNKLTTNLISTLERVSYR